MRREYKKLINNLIIILIAFSFVEEVVFALKIELSTREKRWLKEEKGREIPVFYTGEMDIFFYIDEESKEIKGVYKDFFNELSDETGLKFHLNYLPRMEYRKKLNRNSSVAIFLKAAKNKEREDLYEYIKMFNSYSFKFMSIKEGKNKENWENKVIGVLNGTSEERIFHEKYPNVKLKSFTGDSINELKSKLYTGEVDYLLAKSDYIRDKNTQLSNLVDLNREFYNMAVFKRDMELVSIISKYRESVLEHKLQKMITKNKVDFYRKMLKGNKDYEAVKKKYKKLVILLPTDTSMLPFYNVQYGEYSGYIAQKYKDISEILEIPIEFVHKPSRDDKSLPYHDIKAMSINKSEGYHQESPFYSTDRIIIGRTESDFISDTRDLIGFKTGIKNEINIGRTDVVWRENISTYEEGLKKIESRNLDYVIGEYRVLSILMSSLHYREKMKIVGILPKKNDIFSEIPEQERELINVLEIITLDHLSETYEMKKSLNSSKIIGINIKKYEMLIYVIIFILILFCYFYYQNKKSDKKREHQLDVILSGLDIVNSGRNEYGQESSEKMGKYSKVIGEALNLSKNVVDQLERFAAIYDIGKIGVAEKILKDRDIFMSETPEEFKKHTELGYELVKKMKIGEIAENMVKFHHERWDGKGYPLGLKGREIPVEARIIALCEYYEEVRYRKEFTHEEAVEVLKLKSGEDLDPEIVAVFLEKKWEFEEIYDK